MSPTASAALRRRLRGPWSAEHPMLMVSIVTTVYTSFAADYSSNKMDYDTENTYFEEGRT
jgi:hypothetical protein